MWYSIWTGSLGKVDSILSPLLSLPPSLSPSLSPCRLSSKITVLCSPPSPAYLTSLSVQPVHLLLEHPSKLRLPLNPHPPPHPPPRVIRPLHGPPHPCPRRSGPLLCAELGLCGPQVDAALAAAAAAPPPCGAHESLLRPRAATAAGGGDGGIHAGGEDTSGGGVGGDGGGGAGGAGRAVLWLLATRNRLDMELYARARKLALRQAREARPA